eukprot:m.41601 g.41601  ORF g.41601 m.41601 type:complete len:425 (+) comp6156_c0_seq2:828-2102(+)
MPPPLSLLEGLKSAKLTTWDNDNGCLSPDTPSSSGTDPDYGTTQTSDVTSDDERCRRTTYSPLRAAAGGAMPAAKAKAAANHAASTTRQGQEAGPAYEGKRFDRLGPQEAQTTLSGTAEGGVKTLTNLEPFDEAVIAKIHRQMSARRPLAAFKIDRRLQTGTFSVTWRAVNQQQQAVAIKYSHSLPEYRMVTSARYMSEAQILSQLQHTHVVRFFDSWVIRDTTTLVVEFCPGGDLMQALSSGTVDEDDCKMHMFQAAVGLKYCHSQGIVHGDITPHNMLLGVGGIKLCNFEFAGRIGERRYGKAQGAAEYMAPDMVAKHARSTYTLSPTIDVWSFGISLYVAINGVTPWSLASPQDADFQEYTSAHRTDTAVMWPMLDESLAAALRSMLDVSGTNRADMASVLDAVNGTWWAARLGDVVDATD